MELLDQARITAELSADALSLLSSIEVHQCVGSTNAYLLDRAKAGLSSGSVCFAEQQTAGRGRRGRRWISPFGANLYLSLLWRFVTKVSPLTSLSLVTGIAVARALESLGGAEIGLKWPNDVLWRCRKLGGVLLEYSGEPSGSYYVVAGVGLNVAMPKSAAAYIDQPWVDLRTILGSDAISRSQLAARVLTEMLLAFYDFEYHGFGAFGEDWQRFDLTLGQHVIVKLPNDKIAGIASGVDESGAFLLETATSVKRFMVGEISLRFRE